MTRSYTPVEVAQAYDFPTGATGAGQCVAIIELGGGYQQSDLDTYFGDLDLPVPTVTAVSVDGATNSPVGDPGSADGEVLLDIEVVGAIAPGARIAVYFAPNTDQGFIDAVTTAVHDQTNAPSVISISWGGSENTWTAQAQTALDQAFADAVGPRRDRLRRFRRQRLGRRRRRRSRARGLPRVEPARARLWRDAARDRRRRDGME